MIYEHNGLCFFFKLEYVCSCESTRVRARVWTNELLYEGVGKWACMRKCVRACVWAVGRSVMCAGVCACVLAGMCTCVRADLRACVRVGVRAR